MGNNENLVKTLLLDSSGNYLNVALAIDNKIVKEISYECFHKQSEMMVPEIENILNEYNLEAKDINEVIVTIGPGSYTGLRIALTIAKIMGYALNIPVYTLSSLEILEKKGETSICLINARSKRSYIGIYKDGEVIKEDGVITNEELEKLINEHKDYVLCGDLEYLDKVGYKADIFENMLRLKNESNLVKDIMSLKAVYLKD